MKYQKRAPFILILVSAISLAGNVALAGFGITPPYVRNDSLARGTHYEQKIILVRGDPVEDLIAKAAIDVPGAQDWFSIDKGLEFTLPKGEKQVPIVVSVNVPTGADFKSYNGTIRIVLAPPGGPQAGTVGIALGAQVDVHLTVVNEIIFDFKVREIGVGDLEEGTTFWGLFFPGKISFSMQIENTGNVPASPTAVQFDIYDAKGENLLESVRNTNKIEQVDPFNIKRVTAELPTHLKPGSYRAHYKIFKNEDATSEGDLGLSILPHGTIPGYQGYGFIGLSTSDKAKVISAGLVLLGVVGSAAWFIIKRFRKRAKAK